MNDLFRARKMELGVNIDHVATVRQARMTVEPDPVRAARESEQAGCDGIVCHLRKDRRHIVDEDVVKLRKEVRTRLNLEMSLDEEIVAIASDVLPDQATLVPENRREITTEGGLDVVGNAERVKEVCARLSAKGIEVSLFIDPLVSQVDAAEASGAGIVEFHTGLYAEAFADGTGWERALDEIRDAAGYAVSKGLRACAGHGLNYDNVSHIARIDGIYELNIGHSIISRAVFVGIAAAVREMKELVG